MKLLILLILSTLMISCSSYNYKKDSTENYYKIKTYRLNKKNLQKESFYISKTLLDENCFDDVDDREIYTVPSNSVNLAIDHFYKRFVNVDIRVVVNKYGHSRTEVIAKDSINFDLEFKKCFSEEKYWIFTKTIDYTSFRIKR